MAMNKATLQNDLLNLFNQASEINAGTPAERRAFIAAGMATAFDNYVKSADGKYQAGSLIAGATAVTAPVPANAVIKLS